MSEAPKLRFVPSGKHVRAVAGGDTIAETSSAIMLLEAGHGPVYYFPRGAVRFDRLVPSNRSTHCPLKGDASYWSVAGGDERLEDIAWSYENPIAAFQSLKSHVAFYWERLEQRFEDGQEVFGPPDEPVL